MKTWGRREIKTSFDETTSFDGQKLVSVEPEKGFDTKRASFLKTAERMCNPLHIMVSSVRERSSKCPALLRERGGEKPLVSSSRCSLCCTN